MALSELPAPGEKRARVQVMFDRIAPQYDLLNRLMTAGLDQRWRRLAVSRAGVGAGDRVLDLACGTGDLAQISARRGARVLGVDFSREMLLAAARRRPSARLLQADAERLPLPDASVTVVTCGFTLRNFAFLDAAFSEMARVLAPGGRLALIEVDRPAIPGVAALHSLYFDRFVPRIGGWLSDAAAYRYLPQSTSYLPESPVLLEQVVKHGFRDVTRRRLLLGAAQLIEGVREGGGP